MHDVLDARMSHPAELHVSRLREEALVAGAFQRFRAGDHAGACVRRASGGAVVEVGPGTVHLLLALAHPAALVPCDAARLVNRYVRPLLSALTKLGQKANYFGRDWVSVGKRPVAWVGFAHDATSGRAAMEAFVAVSTPFATGLQKRRASFQGKEPATLEETLARALDADAVADSIALAYLKAYGGLRKATETQGFASVATSDPPWATTAEEAIGEIGAGPDAGGTFRVGGDFLASRDAVAHLEKDLASIIAASHAGHERDLTGAVRASVEAAFSAPDVALEGVRSRATLTDVIVRALSSP